MMDAMSETEPAQSSDSKRHRTWLVMLSATIGALLILVISVLVSQPSGGDDQGAGGGPGGIGAAPTPQEFEAPRGTCLNWTAPDAADIDEVACDQPHLFEVSGTADLGGEFPQGTPYPNAERWQELKQDRCVQVSDEYLESGLDPVGRLAVGAFTPSEEGWQQGDRTLHCGLQQPGPSGELYPVSERVSELDQSETYEAGRCLGINGTAVWDPVDCSEPHAVEITGTVDLSDEFTDGYPSEQDQDGYLATRCRELTAHYAGSPEAVRDKGLVAYWDTLAEESWDAAARQVNCKVSAQLPDGSGLAPITGSVTDEVDVREEPAPELTDEGTPGVPASSER